ncbi:SpoIIE family protein phosphatase [uncultured Cellulomonas sp.]|uniref:SpoIIE family protein phosphatase n=1 Tax=uncultured Cellulomonas sp. TaxID=189682 RepID=UPI002614F9E6|nr:SpoIIE family protein phosphatase [uncultured Cellulomonas sp.]
MTAAAPLSLNHVVDCADEPIRIPGSVQAHGALLVADEGDHTILMASANAAEHLGRPAEELLGLRLADVLGAEHLSALAPGDEGGEPRRVQLNGPDGVRRTVDLLAHRTDGLLVVELEPRGDALPESAPRTRLALRALQGAGTQTELTRMLAHEVRRVTGFDRVMVYRFDEEWNGEVVAEAAREDLEPFLGLHYPASDIPEQARALYTTQWLRSIPDARYTASPLVPPLNPRSGLPLDLSGAALRSVSPVHLQYLANMGVRASMSVSLLSHGRLWGLIACHHYDGPHYPSAATRNLAEFLGRTASLLLQGKEDEARYVDALSITATAADLTRALAANIREPLTTLTEHGGVLDLIDGAAGAAVRVHGEVRLLGQTPSAEEVDELARLWWSSSREPVVSDSLTRDFPTTDLPQRIAATASGVLAVPLMSGGRNDFLMWFRPEVLAEVHWAGNPHAQHVEVTDAGLRLTPRASFAAWVEQVRGRSEPWSASEAAAAKRLGQDVDELLARRTAEDGRIAAALQRIVVTERPAIPAGFSLATRYLPSGRDIIGGDWYDVTVLPDGRVVVMVGDVAGHGMGVAAITAQMRHALRAYLVNEGSASVALRQLSTLIGALLPGKLATVVAAELDPATGTVRVTSAGHLPILHVSGDDARLVREATGPALGVDVATPSDEATIQLAPGDALVLYSDGLVEERGVHLLESLEDLRVRAAAASRDPDELCEQLVSGAPATNDDVTVLAIRRY